MPEKNLKKSVAKANPCFDSGGTMSNQTCPFGGKYQCYFDGNKTETQLRLSARNSRSRTERLFWGNVDALREHGVVVTITCEPLYPGDPDQRITAKAFVASPYSHSHAQGIWTLRRPGVGFKTLRRNTSVSFWGQAFGEKRDEYCVCGILKTYADDRRKWDATFHPAFTPLAGFIPTAATPVILI